MTNIGRAWRVCFAIGALVASAGVAAQYPGGGAGPGGAGGVRQGQGGFGARGGSPDRAVGQPSPAVSELVQFRLSDLREDLKLTAAQMPAWSAYADKVLKLLADVTRADNRLTGELTAPQRLDRLADVARNRSTAIEEIVDAGKALYAQLAPEQRAIADARLALPVQPMLSSTGAVPGFERRGSPAPPRQ